MAKGDIYKELKEMVESDDLTLKQGVRLVMKGMVELFDNIEKEEEWKKKVEERVTALENQTNRDIARIGAIGVVVGSLIAVIGEYVIALI